ncbi:hypothetical protein N9I81_01765 [Planktomarina temperata]|nr:hypothetical protein [Planktomarina temperata]
MFSLEQYKKIIFELNENDLIPTTDWRGIVSKNTLLIRHDIDFSVDFAQTLALFEYELGIRSTYFFMLTSNMYNLFSSENQKLVKSIIKLGHKVSIHFDPTAHETLKEFEHEKRFFENIFNVEVDIVSIHRPGPFLDNNNVSLCGIPHTYSDAYFRSMKYLSDSGGREVKPLISEYLDGDRSQGLHLLIHPIWWVSRGKNPTETLNFWSEKNSEFLKSEVRLNCKTYED